MMNPCEVWNSPRTENTHVYALKNISPMENHPFGVRDDADMEALVESIRQYGVLNPIIVRERRKFGDNYEIVSGHRRYEACKRLGKFDIPVIVRDLTDEEAILTMVDSNLHRERLLPSEKAFAYKMKLDALKQQGKRTDLTSAQVAPKLSTEQIAATENISKDTVKRYIRLTYLIPELLEMMDEDKIALSVGVELSFLDEQLQYDLLRVIEEQECTPSYSQAWHMHRDFNSGTLTAESIEDRLMAEKPNQKAMFKLPLEQVQKFYPNANKKQLEDYVMKACEYYNKALQRQRSRNRDAR